MQAETHLGDAEGLETYEEAVGTLRALQVRECVLILDFGGFRIWIPLSAKPGGLDNLVGKRIGLLKTDMAERPYVVRVIE